MMASTTTTTVRGSVNISTRDNGDRVERYSWEVDLGVLPPSPSEMMMENLPKPVFTRGCFSRPFWTEQLQMVVGPKTFRVTLPYPALPATDDDQFKWTLDLISANILLRQLSPKRAMVNLLSRSLISSRDDDWGLGNPKVIESPLDAMQGGTSASIFVVIKIVGESINHKPLQLEPQHLLKSLFNSPDGLSDVTLVCGGTTFLCHKAILGVGSPVFKAMFLSDTTENRDDIVDIQDVDADALRTMLEWMYGQDIGAELRNFPHRKVDLLKVAHRYFLEPLMMALVSRILASLTWETALEVYALGDMYNVQELKTRSMYVMKRERRRVFSNADIFDECIRRFPEVLKEIVTCSWESDNDDGASPLSSSTRTSRRSL